MRVCEPNDTTLLCRMNITVQQANDAVSVDYGHARDDELLLCQKFENGRISSANLQKA